MSLEQQDITSINKIPKMIRINPAFCIKGDLNVLLFDLILQNHPF